MTPWTLNAEKMVSRDDRKKQARLKHLFCFAAREGERQERRKGEKVCAYLEQQP